MPLFIMICSYTSHFNLCKAKIDKNSINPNIYYELFFLLIYEVTKKNVDLFNIHFLFNKIKFMIKKNILFLSFIVFALNSCQPKADFDITHFGAKGDGTTINTEAIQKAIDAAYEAGGGTVVIPNGVFMSGTIFLKDYVTLHLKANATLLGSPNIENYTERYWGHNKDRQPYHLIVADGAKHITISGTGTIDGNGESFWQEYEKDENGEMITPRWIMAKDIKVSPLVEIVNSEEVRIYGVTIKTGGGWCLHLHDCDLVWVDGISITNNLYGPNSDGIDITGCEDVMISNSYIKTCDDAIVVKTTPDSREARRITVTNCVLETLCAGLKLGATESYHDISDITFSNCVVNKSSRAVGLYVREGATFENITITNITANTNAPLIFNRPIHFMIERRRGDESPHGTIRNVIVSNFISKTEGRILLTAEEGSTMENIIFRDVILDYPMIEDPRRFVEGSGSSQFPKEHLHPDAMGARAAMVVDNVKNLIVENFMVNWPKHEVTPEEWQHPERIENGSLRIHEIDYSKAKQTEFSVLWGRRIQGGHISAPYSTSSSPVMPKYDIKNTSDFKIVN